MQPSSENRDSDVLTILIPGKGPYGVELEEGPGASAAIAGWTSSSGAIQHGGARIGDIIISINNRSFEDEPFDEVVETLRHPSDASKELKFATPAHFKRIRARRSAPVPAAAALPPPLRGPEAAEAAAAAAAATLLPPPPPRRPSTPMDRPGKRESQGQRARSLPAPRTLRETTQVSGSGGAGGGRGIFSSEIRASRVVAGARPFAEYEIFCSMKITGKHASATPGALCQWSVWRRFSDFDRLHGSLEVLLGWQMAACRLPPRHLLALDKLGGRFVGRRRGELGTYWRKIMAVPRLTDFHRPYCSAELKLFLEVEDRLPWLAPPPPRRRRVVSPEASNAAAAADPAAAAQRAELEARVAANQRERLRRRQRETSRAARLRAERCRRWLANKERPENGTPLPTSSSSPESKVEPSPSPTHLSYQEKAEFPASGAKQFPNSGSPLMPEPSETAGRRGGKAFLIGAVAVPFTDVTNEQPGRGGRGGEEGGDSSLSGGDGTNAGGFKEEGNDCSLSAGDGINDADGAAEGARRAGAQYAVAAATATPPQLSPSPVIMVAKRGARGGSTETEARGSFGRLGSESMMQQAVHPAEETTSSSRNKEDPENEKPLLKEKQQGRLPVPEEVVEKPAASSVQERKHGKPPTRPHEFEEILDLTPPAPQFESARASPTNQLLSTYNDNTAGTT